MGARLKAVLVALLCASAAAAQVQESTTVEVVQVPVYVTARGTSLSNLGRENFRLFINGKQQPIDYFDVIDFAAAPAEEKRDPRQRRLYLLVFDLTFSSPNALQRAQKAAEQIIQSGGGHDTFGIATLLPAGGANVVVPFSHDRVALLRAVRNLRPSLMPDPLRIAVTPAERSGVAAGAIVGGAEGVFGEGGPEEESMRRAIEDMVGDLADLAARLAPIEGVKHVVLLSSGFDAGFIHGVPRQQLSRGMFEQPRAVGARNLRFDSRLLGAIRKMHDTFSGSSVFLDAIDIGGLRPMQSVFDNEALYALTRDTGGSVVDRQNDLGAAMLRLAELQRVTYVLSFNAHKTGRDENSIVVKLVDVPRGAHASYRQSYRSVSDPPDSGDPLRLADVVMNDIPQTGFTTTAQVQTTPGHAVINVDVAAGELGPQSGGMTLQGDVLLYVFSGPEAVAFNRKQITIEPRAMASLVAATPIRISQAFDLPPGHYAAKALVRFGLNGALGFARADFTVPPSSP